MKKTSKMKKQIYIGLLAGLGLSAGALSFTPDYSHADYAASGKNFDGKTIFKGIFFGDSQVGQFIPEISEQMINKKTKNMDAVLDGISKRNPAFFNEFKASMESGDPVKMSNALDQAAGLLAVKNTEAEDGNTETGFETFIVVAAESSGIQLIWVPGPLNNFATASSTTRGTNLSLEREKGIAYLATQLKK